MLMNSLCAIALGFLLDMILGDGRSVFYPINLIKKYAAFLQKKLKSVYDSSREAQKVAGGMYLFIMLASVFVVCLALFVAAYSISNTIGIIVEGIMCWSAVSVKKPKAVATGVMRSVKAGNLEVAQKRYNALTNRDNGNVNGDLIIKGSVEYLAETIINKAVAPVFWMGLFGGIGGLLYRTVNILGEDVGDGQDENKYFGSSAKKAHIVVRYVPARIAGLLSLLDAAFLGLDAKNAVEIYDKESKTEDYCTGQTVSVCAGALGIVLYGSTNINGRAIRRDSVGKKMKNYNPLDIYWTSQIMNGVFAVNVLLAAIFRLLIFIIF